MLQGSLVNILGIIGTKREPREHQNLIQNAKNNSTTNSNEILPVSLKSS